MTGKEALIILSKCCSALAFEEGKWNISKRENEALQTLKEIVQKYNKYKRAFEILEDKLWIKVQELREWEKEEYKKEYELITHSTQRFITKKEYKLLEELMKDENC